MQQKIIIDTNVYIDIFNDDRHENLRNPFERIVFLAHPVLHELWMGAKGKREIKHLTTLQNEFVKLKRLLVLHHLHCYQSAGLVIGFVVPEDSVPFIQSTTTISRLRLWHGRSTLR